jgi:predicted DsbA family dithiol-disulfide isomerase
MTPHNSANMPSLTVEVWSDVVCPWCYIGKRRLEAALARFPRQDAVTVRWRSYELNPSAPKTATESTREMLARKYGVGLEQADAMQARVAGLAAQEGLRYRLDLTRPESSFDAHRLIHFAETRGLQDAMKERLFAAYFTEGASIGDRKTLLGLAKDVGLDGNEAGAILDGDAFADAVRDDVRQAGQLGIQGVPFFVIAGRLGVSGAQSADTLLEVLEKGWEEGSDA